MFRKDNFEQYIQERIIFYNLLQDFTICENDLSDILILDYHFFQEINHNFRDYFKWRKLNERLSASSSKMYKQRLSSFSPEIAELQKYNGPAVYWFKIDHSGSSSNSKLLKKFTTARKRSGWWSKARKITDNNTEYLYIGKVEKNLGDRFIQHLGLGHKMTSSLKLLNWFSEFEDVKLSFQYLKVDPMYKYHLEDIENVIWRKCKPLLGAEPRIKQFIHSHQ